MFAFGIAESLEICFLDQHRTINFGTIGLSLDADVVTFLRRDNIYYLQPQRSLLFCQHLQNVLSKSTHRGSDKYVLLQIGVFSLSLTI